MQWYIIGTVADSGYGGVRITDLSKTLDTTLAFLTNTVNLLVSKEILYRRANDADNRSSYVVMNDSYVTTYNKIERELRAKLRESIFSRITPEELAIYIEVINKFSDLK